MPEGSQQLGHRPPRMQLSYTDGGLPPFGGPWGLPGLSSVRGRGWGRPGGVAGPCWCTQDPSGSTAPFPYCERGETVLLP